MLRDHDLVIDFHLDEKKSGGNRNVYDVHVYSPEYGCEVFPFFCQPGIPQTTMEILFLTAVKEEAASYINSDSFESWANEMSYDLSEMSRKELKYLRNEYNAVGESVEKIERLSGGETDFFIFDSRPVAGWTCSIYINDECASIAVFNNGRCLALAKGLDFQDDEVFVNAGTSEEINNFLKELVLEVSKFKEPKDCERWKCASIHYGDEAVSERNDLIRKGSRLACDGTEIILSHFENSEQQSCSMRQ